MNEPHKNELLTRMDEWNDRLTDRALAEVAGGEAPPNLSERILAAATAARPVATQSASRSWRYRWLGLAVAASLLVGTTWSLLPSDDLGHPSRTAAKLNRLDSEPRLRIEEGRAGEFDADGSTRGQYGDELSNEELKELMQRNERSARLPADASPELRKELGLPPLSAARSQSSPKTVAGRESPNSQPISDAHSLEELQSRRRKYASVDLGDKPESGRKENLAVTDGPPARPALELLGRVSKDNLRAVRDREVRFGQREQVLRQTNPPIKFEVEEVRELVARGVLPAEILGQAESELGTGAGFSGDQYTRIEENPFINAVGGDAVSTFSIDVDTASYANVRQFLKDMNQLPPPDAVRIEELVNYFRYDYAGPEANDAAPFAAHVEVASCPWQPEHRLVRIGIQGRPIDRRERPISNLVFLVDVSGSMNRPNKLPLVVEGLQQLTRELGENDRVAIVVYANSQGLVLDSTPGSDQRTILDALGRLRAGGSTAGGAGIELAYQIAEDHFVAGGTNRVILCTDGDFNVGVTSTAELERLVEKKAADTGVFLSVLGFGRGNLNDAMMEAISGRAGGNYYYVDNRREARKVLVEEMSGTLVTIAKDVKVQVEFNPRQVAGFRLLGYENRMLRTEDFNDDKKDAGEIGAGHAVTALYEVVPNGQPVEIPPVDELKYQPTTGLNGRSQLGDGNGSDSGNPVRGVANDTDADDVSHELLTLKMRYKQPDGDTSSKLERPVTDDGREFATATTDFQFAAAVAEFGLLLRDSKHKGSATWDAALEIAESSQGSDPHGYRAEFVELIRRARSLKSGR